MDVPIDTCIGIFELYALNRLMLEIQYANLLVAEAMPPKITLSRSEAHANRVIENLTDVFQRITVSSVVQQPPPEARVINTTNSPALETEVY